ncbi:hypothetical protein [Streptomyces carpinensis]|uniref:Uncharacterized protein n=1 Tax=Streptomyces carpinensis TaxID=66369 RepID=A0ABV1W8S1_9ACTN|nr:hypothetical protein [Streptomyces carpinensis]
MTAGPDERLRIATDDAPADDDQDEQRIREELRRRNVGPGGPASAPPPAVPEQPADSGQRASRLPDWVRARFPRPADPEPADQAEPVDRAEAQPSARAGNRLTPWWELRKPDLADLHPDIDTADEGLKGDEAAGEEPAPTPAKPRSSRRRIFKTSPPDDEYGEYVGEEQAPGRRHWDRPVLGRPPGLPPKRQNLFTWWRSVEAHNKWLLYHGTGLLGGIYIGAFHEGYLSAAYIAAHGFADIESIFIAGLAGGLFLLDYRVRNWFPLLAWAVRALSTSVIVGALWYGAPIT